MMFLLNMNTWAKCDNVGNEITCNEYTVRFYNQHFLVLTDRQEMKVWAISQM